jgi:hypothetical protein
MDFPCYDRSNTRPETSQGFIEACRTTRRWQKSCPTTRGEEVACMYSKTTVELYRASCIFANIQASLNLFIRTSRKSISSSRRCRAGTNTAAASWDQQTTAKVTLEGIKRPAVLFRTAAARREVLRRPAVNDKPRKMDTRWQALRSITKFCSGVLTSIPKAQGAFERAFGYFSRAKYDL